MPTRKYSLIEVALLATAFKKSPQTIARWINANDDRLTSEKAKEVLVNSTNTYYRVRPIPQSPKSKK